MRAVLSGSRDRLDRSYKAITDRLPPHLAGLLDRLRPSYRDSWGGPMNGQLERRRIVQELAQKGGFDVVLETGTFRGTTTEYLHSVFGVPVHTTEGNPRYHTYSQRRFAGNPEVVTHGDDSRVFLASFAREGGDALTPFIYLDAHWEDDLPLPEELSIIARTWPRAVVMIDDFEVPDDPGYRFPDYGPGKRLAPEILPEREMLEWTLSFPAVPSARETGPSMGCCVLFGPEAPIAADDIRTLRTTSDWPRRSR